jgi:hypothetical protein
MADTICGYGPNRCTKTAGYWYPVMGGGNAYLCEEHVAPMRRYAARIGEEFRMPSQMRSVGRTVRKPAKATAMATVGSSIPRSAYDALEQHCEAHGTTKGAVIREAVLEWLERHAVSPEAVTRGEG